MDLSIIIPVHNESRRLPICMDMLLPYLKTLNLKTEIILVENGSSDATPEMCELYAKYHPGKVISLVNELRGKGAAVRLGMLEARGWHRLMMDVDLAVPVDYIGVFYHIATYQDAPTIVIGSRELPDSRRINEPEYRHVMGRIWNRVSEAILPVNILDTQCGFKLFPARIAEDLFGNSLSDGMAFDVELLAIARLRCYQIIETPVTWYADGDSRVRVVGDTLNMIQDLLAIERRIKQGVYATPASIPA